MNSNTNEVTNGFNVGFEHELTDFLLRATQDELNTMADPDKVTFFIEEEANSSITDSDKNNDIAGDAVDMALLATSFFDGWINEPITMDVRAVSMEGLTLPMKSQPQVKILLMNCVATVERLEM
jgi:hypothetical protein